MPRPRPVRVCTGTVGASPGTRAHRRRVRARRPNTPIGPHDSGEPRLGRRVRPLVRAMDRLAPEACPPKPVASRTSAAESRPASARRPPGPAAIRPVSAVHRLRAGVCHTSPYFIRRADGTLRPGRVVGSPGPPAVRTGPRRASRSPPIRRPDRGSRRPCRLVTSLFRRGQRPVPAVPPPGLGVRRLKRAWIPPESAPFRLLLPVIRPSPHDVRPGLHVLPPGKHPCLPSRAEPVRRRRIPFLAVEQPGSAPTACRSVRASVSAGRSPESALTTPCANDGGRAGHVPAGAPGRSAYGSFYAREGRPEGHGRPDRPRTRARPPRCPPHGADTFSTLRDRMVHPQPMSHS